MFHVKHLPVCSESLQGRQRPFLAPRRIEARLSVPSLCTGAGAEAAIMPAARLHPLNMNRGPVRCPPLPRRSLEGWGWRVVFHVKHSLFGVPVACAYGRGLWVRITLAKSAIPEKAAWFVSYGILPDGLRKNRTRRIPSGRSRFFVLSAIHVDNIHLPSCRTHPVVKPKPGKPSPVAHLRRIRSFHCALHVRRSPRPCLAFRIIPPSVSLPPCALVSLLTNALDISSNPTDALPSRPCRLQQGAS